ncbi:MAG: YncE family protein, partial [bacterium]
MRIVTCTVVGMLSLTLGCTAPPGKSTKDAAKDKAAKATTPAAPAKPVLEEHPGGVVYVAAAGSDELVMFDRVSLELIGTPIHAGHEPGSIAIAPDGRVYFPARYMNSDDIAATTPKSDDPEHPSIPDGFRSGSLWAVDSSKGNQIQSKGYIGSSDKDLDGVFVVLHPEGTWAAIADQADNNIEFRDLSDNEQKKNRTVAVGSGPFGEAFTSDGMYFLVANHDEANAVDPDTVSLINFLGDNAGPTEVAKIPVGAQPSQITVSPDNKVAYVTVTGSNKVVAINLATKAVVGEWALTGMPQGIARDALGVMYYVTLQDQNSVVKIDATTGQ